MINKEINVVKPKLNVVKPKLLSVCNNSNIHYYSYFKRVIFMDLYNAIRVLIHTKVTIYDK